MTRAEELLLGFEQLTQAGKIRYVGLSDFPAWYASRAVTLADVRGQAGPEVLQLEYSLLERTIEHEHLPLADGPDLAVMAWSPLGGGALTGKHRRGETGRASKGGGPVHTEDERSAAIVDAVATVAARP